MRPGRRARRSFLRRPQGEGKGGRGRGEERSGSQSSGNEGPTHPHCRTVCHCSRPSCRRHARRLPGLCIAGAHLPRALRPRKARPTGPLAVHPEPGGAGYGGEGLCARPAPPSGSEWGCDGRYEAAILGELSGGALSSHTRDPSAPRGRATSAGCPCVRPYPPALRGALSARAGPPPPGAPARPWLPEGGRGGHLLRCPNPRRRAAGLSLPAGRTFVSARRLLSPPSVNHSWSPGEEGRPRDARPFKGPARLFGAAARRPSRGTGPERHQGLRVPVQDLAPAFKCGATCQYPGKPSGLL